MFDKLHIFLGATVADAAARPLHWVYDKKKLNSYLKGKKDIAFFKQNRSPFYSIKTGEVSGYNDVGQVMFKTLTTTVNQKEVIKLFKKNIVKNFGPGSKYWKNLSLRKKYKKIKWKTAMKGPWIHQNILETIKNIKLKKTITGGTKVNESDGYCASLPFYFSDNSDQKTKKIINGLQVDYNARQEKEGIVRLYEEEGSFIGIGSVDSSMKLSPKRLINTQKYSASPLKI